MKRFYSTSYFKHISSEKFANKNVIKVPKKEYSETMHLDLEQIACLGDVGPDIREDTIILLIDLGYVFWLNRNIEY